ncbi:undecaprenyl-diphosphatase UppP [Bdellovibrionota bacterium FG-2]
MTIFNSIILGFIQGLTEFLPISSTAHLTLAGKFIHVIDLEHPEQWTAFMAVIQLGTLLAVLVYFRKEISNITLAFCQENFARKPVTQQSFDSRLGWMIILGTIPVVVIGLSLKHVIEGGLTKSVFVIAVNLVLFGLILGLAEKWAKHRKTMAETTLLDSFLIGVAQAFALIPGASRSGTTMTAGLLLGIKRSEAARLSFLLSIPAVFASGMLELHQALKWVAPAQILELAIGTLTAFVTGYLAVSTLITFLKKYSNSVFVLYRIFFGAGLLGLLYLGRI